MAEWNNVMEEFANLVADKVILKLKAEEFKARASENASPSSELPLINTSGLQPYNVKNNKDGSIQFVEPKTTTNSGVSISLPEPSLPKPAVSSKDKRISELSKIDVRALRKKIARVENATVADYSHLTKDELVQVVWKLEGILGRTLDQEIERLDSSIPDDEDTSSVEPDDDNDLGVLTRQEAEALDLGVLKRYALSQGVTEGDLKGLDIEAVVDLLYGSEAVTQAPVTPEEDSEPEDDSDSDDDVIELDPDEVKVMSLAELRSLVEDLNEQGADISYDRSTKREVLVEKILSVLVEV